MEQFLACKLVNKHTSKEQMNNSNYKILPDLKLIIELCINNTTVDSYIKHTKKLLQDDLFNPNYNFLVDFRNTEFIIDYEKDISTYLSFVKTLVSNDYKTKTAILISTPNQVVVSTLYSMDHQNSYDNALIFSSLESGLNYLSFEGNDRYLIETTIEIMKKEIS